MSDLLITAARRANTTVLFKTHAKDESELRVKMGALLKWAQANSEELNVTVLNADEGTVVSAPVRPGHKLWDKLNAE